MSLCSECGKTYASPVGLRRHINSQHQRTEWHVCECGRQFLDPAGRSRCRAGHSRSFGCSASGCSYRSSRKDSVKQHIRRRHQNSTKIHVVTLPPSPAPSTNSSNDELGSDASPSPDEAPMAPCFLPLPPPVLAVCPYPLVQQVLYYPAPSPWSLHFSGV
ncbi:hypothetical protein M407DRAFT_188494 [Tulasnella calospora MUT 4182]|uniref:C2H2-type domain-containing protein n=1 Tax=Tulasnella calospora MUT 4182 TaxID=1051891 RepID=A0A0C3L205_9AGAM|nr:hypothetical protein M407DRAFT_188494 [Tulasnella calospora MUT 4182]